MSRLIDDLHHLHDHYIESVNLAIASDDVERARSLAADYDDEAIDLITTHATATR